MCAEQIRTVSYSARTRGSPVGQLEQNCTVARVIPDRCTRIPVELMPSNAFMQACRIGAVLSPKRNSVSFLDRPRLKPLGVAKFVGDGLPVSRVSCVGDDEVFEICIFEHGQEYPLLLSVAMPVNLVNPQFHELLLWLVEAGYCVQADPKDIIGRLIDRSCRSAALMTKSRVLM